MFSVNALVSEPIRPSKLWYHVFFGSGFNHVTVERGEVTARRCERGWSDMNIRGDTCYRTVVCCREGAKPSSERTPSHVSSDVWSLQWTDGLMTDRRNQSWGLKSTFSPQNIIFTKECLIIYGNLSLLPLCMCASVLGLRLHTFTIFICPWNWTGSFFSLSFGFGSCVPARCVCVTAGRWRLFLLLHPRQAVTSSQLRFPCERRGLNSMFPAKPRCRWCD